MLLRGLTGLLTVHNSLHTLHLMYVDSVQNMWTLQNTFCVIVKNFVAESGRNTLVEPFWSLLIYGKLSQGGCGLFL